MMKDTNKRANKITAAGVIQIIAGSLLALTFGTIELVISLVRGGLSIFGNALSLTDGGADERLPVLLIIGTLFGGIFILRGYINYKLASRFRKVARAIGDNPHISFINLERRLFWSRSKVLRVLKQQMKEGLWPDAHIDMTNEVFLVDYNPVFVQADSGNATLDEQISGANGMINNLAALSRQITDTQLKERVERISGIAGQIYAYAAKHPDKAGLVRRLSNYFLPTTVTLLEKYIELQSQSIKTDNMNEAMQKIAQVMVTLEDVFHNRLDALYGEKVMDVDVEIDVLQNMAEM